MQKVRLAVRALMRRPAFAAAAVLTLALGIGANTAVFSVVNGILLKSLPYAEPDRLAAIWPQRAVANREVDYLRTHARSYDDVGSYSPGWLVALTGVDVPEQLNSARVSGNLFDMLGVRPLLGRTFGIATETPGNDDVAVLSYRLWQRKFAGDPGVIGRKLTLDQRPYTVVAVMPRQFQIIDAETDLWTPMTMDRGAMAWAGATTLLIGRLKGGIDAATAGREFAALAQQMRTAFAERDDYAADARVLPLKEAVTGDLRPLLLIVTGAVMFILLAAVANVANLLLVRTSERAVEIAVRRSLGAGTRQLVSQFAVESLVLSAAGGVLGLLLALAGVPLLRGLLPPDTPRVQEITVDASVLLACVLTSLATAVAFGVTPLFASLRASIESGLRGGRAAGLTRHAARGRAALVAAQVALALVLVTGATLMVRTLANLHRVNPGFRAAQVLTMHLQPTGFDSDDQLRAYWREVRRRVSQVNGVENVATVLHLPMAGRMWQGDVRVEGRDVAAGAAPPRTAWQSISGDYLGTLGIPLLRGRALDDRDVAESTPVILVNDAFVRRVFPGEDPIGRRIKAGHATEDVWFTIVGVVGSVRHSGLGREPGPEVYVPFDQKVVYANALVVRTRGNPAALATEIQRTIWSIRPDVPVTGVRTLSEIVDASVATQRMVLVLVGLFAVIGIVLGLVGIYGIVAYAARIRAREIGVRIALGAARSDVISLMMRQGATAIVGGTAVGIAAAAVLTRVLRSLLYGVTPLDALTFALVPVAVIVLAALATLVPAVRAAGVDASMVLRD